MRWIWQRGSSGRAGELEGVGQTLANQMRAMLQQAIAEDAIRVRQHAHTEEWISVVRNGLYRGVCGFNVSVPAEFQMALVDRGDRMIFHSVGRMTLTLIYGSDCVVIESRSEYPRLPMPMSVQIWREANGSLRFRAVPDAPIFTKEIMTQAEFLASVLRMACNQDLDEGTHC